MSIIPTLLSKYQRISAPTFHWQQYFELYRWLTGNPDPRLGEGLYTRFVFHPERRELCLQVVLYYRIQSFPYHVNDFALFYAYFDDQYRMVRLLYDAGHHHARLAPIRQPMRLTVQYPWRAFRVGKGMVARSLQAAEFPLTDKILRDWWIRPDKGQFKIRSKFVDPWHPGLERPENGAWASFRDEMICPDCGSVKLLDQMVPKENVLRSTIRCCGRKYDICYDFYSMEVGYCDEIHA